MTIELPESTKSEQGLVTSDCVTDVKQNTACDHTALRWASGVSLCPWQVCFTKGWRTESSRVSLCSPSGLLICYPLASAHPELELQACTAILYFIKLLAKKNTWTHSLASSILFHCSFCVTEAPKGGVRTNTRVSWRLQLHIQAASLQEEGWEFPLTATTKTPTLQTFNTTASFFSLLAVPLKMIPLPWFFPNFIMNGVMWQALICVWKLSFGVSCLGFL